MLKLHIDRTPHDVKLTSAYAHIQYGGAKPDTEQQQQPQIQKTALKVRAVRKRTHEQYYICYSLGRIGRNNYIPSGTEVQRLEK